MSLIEEERYGEIAVSPPLGAGQHIILRIIARGAVGVCVHFAHQPLGTEASIWKKCVSKPQTFLDKLSKFLYLLFLLRSREGIGE